MTRKAPEHSGDVLKHDFWTAPALDELARAQT